VNTTKECPLSTKDESEKISRESLLPVSRAELAGRINAMYHDLQAEEFDAIHKFRHELEGLFWRRHVAPRLVRENPGYGLDLCTGTGLVPRVLQETLSDDVHVVCIDVSQVALLKARNTVGDASHVAVSVGSAETLPLPDESMDWVTLNAGLHHIPRPEEALREIARVLKPGGYFALGFEPNARFFSSLIPLFLEKILSYACWYLSPRRNFHRMKRMLGCDGEHDSESARLIAMNQALVDEGLIDAPLSLVELRELVDWHTHDQTEEDEGQGFGAEQLIDRLFPGYVVEYIRYTDYGGAALKRHPLLRALYDATMRALFPGRGQVFSWILRKPRAGTSEGQR